MTPDSTPHDEIRRFEEQYESQPESLVFARLADAYRKTGQTGRALEVLEEGLIRHPDYASGHIVHARTLRDLGHLDEAGQSFRRVVELDPENLVAMRELASLADERGDLAEARYWYRRLVRVDPSNEEVSRRLVELEEDPGALAEIQAADAAGAERSEAVADEEPQPGSEWWNDPAEPADTAPAEPDLLDDTPLPDDEVVAAILNGDVAQTIGGEDTWWYEERSEEQPPKPSAEADLLTRTMADLYAEQGLFGEAAAIYEELLRDSPDDPLLKGRLAEMRDRMALPGPDSEIEARAEPAEAGILADPEVASETIPDTYRAPEEPPSSHPPGTLVADELRRILRRGEESAALLPDPEADAESDPSEILERADAVESTDEAEMSDFARDWLSGLQDRG